MKIKYGIWGGRFQIIHKGHEFVLQYVAKNYPHVCIGIVNPNPLTPAWNILEHEKFEPQKNPFSYFQRIYLWNKLLRYHGIEAVIVPHWHPRKSLKLESTFLPLSKKSREWIIPFLQDEEYKITDLEKMGEKVFTLLEEPAELRIIHASEIKRLFDIKDVNFKMNIPEPIQLITEEFLKKKSMDEQFIVIPILNDNLHALLFCGGIQLSVDKGKNLIFAPIVNVRNEDNWWKFEPTDSDYFTFYQKHEIINNVMKNLNFYDYMVIPIIVKNNKCEAIDSFLPDSNNRSWFFINGINSSSLFKEFRFEDILRYDLNAIPEDIYLNVFSSIFDSYNERHYYDKLFNDDENESEDGEQMSKNDFRNMSVNSFTYVEGNIEGNVNQNTYLDTKYRNVEKIISEILKTSSETEFKNLLKEADEACVSKTQTEIEQIIEDTVKKYIDSTEKKNSFLQKVKQFTINMSNSIVAGLLLQSIKNKVFGT